MGLKDRIWGRSVRKAIDLDTRLQLSPIRSAPAKGLPPSVEVALAIPRSLFDCEAYLRENRDVAAAVSAGHTQAYEHYVSYGHKEELAGVRPRSLPKMSAPLGVSAPDSHSLIDRVIHLEMEKEALLKGWDHQLPHIAGVTFEMLSEEVDDALIPRLDKLDCDEAELDDDQGFWRANGFLIKERLIPEELIERYCAIRELHPSAGGWSCPVPYMHLKEIRDISLYMPIMDIMRKLIGEEMGLHLNLTGWVSTDRNWHQDDYLNPPYINSWYCAVWVALDDIHPDCGPFEFVPGSHKWPLMKSPKVRMFLNAEERNSSNWPSIAERFVNDIAENEILKSGFERRKFIAKKGDVLFWHGRLMHRGSYANTVGMQRKALISHYSGLSHRSDMPKYERDENGSAFFIHNIPLD